MIALDAMDTRRPRRPADRALVALARATRRFHPRGTERLLRALYDPERREHDRFETLVRLDDSTLMLCDTGSFIEWRVFFFGAYEPEVRTLLRSLCPVGGVAIDAGANVGCHALAMAAAVGEAGSVLAFEPAPQSFRRLAANAALNGLPQLVPFAIALGERPGTLELASPPPGHAQHGMATFHADNLAGAVREIVRVPVPVRTLDGVVADHALHRVDVIKVDVEGHELAVLRGAAGTLARHRPAIVFEFARRWAQHAGYRFNDLRHYFDEHRYALHMIPARGGPSSLRRDAEPPDGNLLALPL